jgi:hypothetical protein
VRIVSLEYRLAAAQAMTQVLRRRLGEQPLPNS